MKTIALFQLFIITGVASFAQAPAWQWADNASGKIYTDNMALDEHGNAYVAASFINDSATFGSTTLINHSTNNTFDILVAKYGASGNLLWATEAGGNKNDNCNSIAVDGQGNTYLTGNFNSDTLRFGSYTLVNKDNTGVTSDIFIVKYDSGGNVVWAKDAGGNNGDVGSAITTAPGGYEYLTGFFASGSITFDNTTLNNAAAGKNYDIFITKLDTAGNTIWAIGSNNVTDLTTSYLIATDGSNAYISGVYSDSTFNMGNVKVNNPGGNNPVQSTFVIKVDAAGNTKWVTNIGVNTIAAGTRLITDASKNVYLTGGFFGASAVFGSLTVTSSDSNNTSFYLTKLDTSGNVLWAKGATQTRDAYGQGIATDANGNIYVGGNFEGSLNMGKGNLVSNDTTDDFVDFFITKYDANGNPQWSTDGGGTKNDVLSGIVADSTNNVYVYGNSLSPEIAFGNDTLTNSKPTDLDAFIAKLSGFTTGIAQLTAKTTTTLIYPNPSEGSFVFVTETEVPLQLIITNTLGQKVYNTQINSNKTEIHLNNQPKGIYFYSLRNNDGNTAETGKVVIE